MRRVKLDRIDLQILQDLQEDGRITNVELARRAGISAPPCLRRVRALEEAGYIKGYHAERSEEHTSELQSLMRISYAVFCLKKQKTIRTHAHAKNIEHRHRN